MSKERDLQRIVDCGVVAIVRFDRPEELVEVARAIRAGGVDVIEFTMTTPDALSILSASAEEFGDEVLLGAGTVLDPETARAAILAGAKYIISPTLNPRMIELCRRYGVIAVPGAFTPTEILTAWELGADLVKVFPAGAMGPGYIKDIMSPLPQVRLLPTGGVSLSNAAQFIEAGAAAVAAGSSLVDKRAVAEKDFARLTEVASAFATAIRQARGLT
ncbi:MAG: bifunctional 4-hydroxy-2-oxoglutarate aldolase/2-dehydro-3-deoxy-phosphogluconate aldolase [Anaerolineae bacterium]|nr:bifunctional 4-hydroxy-2-oxoglutarate aldolase/2-dehydro-3-deoxy-phosphogluconate aldolase [Anaerolineae bacterium]NIN99876.1 bifunctional 4-hydroxy-2-oxoglutarate aldolase/2-dehydro-3-deoxy-phosphogluconate aldolase [Anaerolineae bacterium]NIQ82653.1 bifunctional 4-hydroxy-2-oxoglutarate aldolase/2-dehydro-3-deoxy-phosphogluconate aldolase [Anaerolineae bacterium]